MTQEFNAKAFSVLGFERADAIVTRDPVQFAAYAPSREAAEGDRDAYRPTHPKIRLWVIRDNATGADSFSFAYLGDKQA